MVAQGCDDLQIFQLKNKEQSHMYVPKNIWFNNNEILDTNTCEKSLQIMWCAPVQ